MRFEIIYTVGNSVRRDVIEAQDLSAAEHKANLKHPTWIDIRVESFDPSSTLTEVMT